MTEKHDSRYCLHTGWYDLLTTEAKINNIDITSLNSYQLIKKNNQGEYDIRALRKFHFEIIEKNNGYNISLKAAQHVTPFTFGCYSIALFSCHTLYDFLNIACSNFIYVAPQVQLSVNKNNDKVEVWILNNHSPDTSKVTKPGLIVIVSTLLEMMRKMTGGKAIPVELYAPNLEYKSNEIQYFQQRYNCKKIESKSLIVLSFIKNHLNTPLKNYNPEIHYHNLNFVKERVVKLSKQDIRLQVCSIFDQYDTLKDININIVAKQLLTSTRTLNRRLASIDTNFKNTLDCYRLDKAIRLLKDPDINITEITYQLGFSELSSFSRAFKRWTGECPTKLRKQSIKHI